MKKAIRRRTYLKSAIVVSAVFAALIGFGKFSAERLKTAASASGPSPSYTNGPGEDNCTACHTSYPVNSGTGSVSITGIPANYLPNQQVAVTVTTSQSDAVIYGFEMTAIDSVGRAAGTYTLTPQSPQPIQTVDGFVGGNTRRYIEHTIDGVLPTQFGSKSWKFTWNAPAQRIGKIGFYAAGNAANSDGSTSGDYIYSTSAATLSGSAISNFDGDIASDIGVFRPSEGNWYSLNISNNGFQAFHFGQAGDRIVPGDYDGDGKSDYAVFRPSNGYWFIQRSTLGFAVVQFGLADDIPAAGDFDGDLKTDFAVFRPSSGVWFIQGSTAGFSAIQFGANGDRPVQGDYDGDGKTDCAVYRPSEGNWYLLRSQAGFTAFHFGITEDKPVPGDYDGDGKTDIAVFRPSSGFWFALNSTTGFTVTQFGQLGDIASPGDFDGDGKSDTAVFRPSGGVWFLIRSSDGGFYATQFGTNGDKPIPAGYIPDQ